jgi:two-component system phosphate regulon sensor histidine kinase PhoR
VVIPIHFDGLDGVLRSAKPVDEIKALINETLQMIMIGILISAVIAFIVAYLITRRLMKPVNELTVMARKIADGDYDNKIYIDQKDEIGDLAKAFNVMAYNLRLNMWELETKNNELESILTSMSNGIIVVDADYKITLFNKMFIELFNVEDSDIKGKLFYEATRNLIIFQVLESSYENRENVVKEAKITTPDGDKVYLLFASPIINTRDKIRGTLLVVQDVTKIRKLESIRSDFVSNVTHELKTPLTSIRGFVETLKSGALNEDVGIKFLDIIDIEAERLELLINDILILSEIESLMGDQNQGNYDLIALSTEVVELLKPKAEKKGLKIMTDYQEQLPLFECNPHRIKQLLINLMDNAVKYTEEGSVTIRLRIEYMGYIIEIEDTGIGVEKAHIPRLFERFYRVDGGRSRKMGGTGLGLSIVKHIVELYNGSIRVTSEINKGTKITIRLPIKD